MSIRNIDRPDLPHIATHCANTRRNSHRFSIDWTPWLENKLTILLRALEFLFHVCWRAKPESNNVANIYIVQLHIHFWHKFQASIISRRQNRKKSLIRRSSSRDISTVLNLHIVQSLSKKLNLTAFNSLEVFVNYLTIWLLWWYVNRYQFQSFFIPLLIKRNFSSWLKNWVKMSDKLLLSMG